MRVASEGILVRGKKLRCCEGGGCGGALVQGEACGWREIQCCVYMLPREGGEVAGGALLCSCTNVATQLRSRKLIRESVGRT